MKPFFFKKRFLAPVLIVFLLVLTGCVNPFQTQTKPTTRSQTEQAVPQQPKVPTPSSTESNTKPVTNNVSVIIQNFSFVPSVKTITQGMTVSWTNNDSMPHTVTSDGNFDSGSISTGQSFSFTFNKTGNFEYHCSIHPSMTGTIIVE